MPALTISLDEPFTRDSACDLLRIPEQQLPTLLAAARAAKERFKPGIITYSKKVFLPLTNLCRDYWATASSVGTQESLALTP